VFVHHAGGATFNGNSIDYSLAIRNNLRIFKKKWALSSLDETTLRRWLMLHAIEEAQRLDQQGATDDAVAMLIQKGIKADPSCKTPYVALAEMLISAGRYDEALQVLPEMPADTDRIIPDEFRGVCYAALGDNSASLQAVQQAFSSGVRRPRVMVTMGTLAARQGELNEAEQHFQHAIKLDPSCGEGWLALGMLLWGRDDREGAWQAIRRAAIVTPLNQEIITIYRDMAARLDRLNDAAQLIGEAFRVNPDSRALALAHVEALAECGSEKLALDACEKFLVHFGIDDKLLSLALQLRGDIGRYDIRANNRGESVSLCMIVKDEEPLLARCLASARVVVHEMIVVDTGSSDRTAAIATVFGARVFEFPWNGSFSDARNHAVKQATGDWILVLDADEVLSQRDYIPLQKELRASRAKKCAWSILTRNYTARVNAQGWTANDGSYPSEEAADGWHPSWKVRLFPNDKRIRFKGEVHELVEESLRKAGFAIKQSTVVVHHYGGLKDTQNREKMLHYFELGRKKLEGQVADATALSELAVQANELGLFEEALVLWDRVLAIQPESAEAFFNKSYAFIGLKRYGDGMASSRRALELDPDLKEASFNFGTCALYAGDPCEAIVCVESMLGRNPGYPPLLSLLTVLYLVTGQLEKAESTFAELKTRNYAIGDYIRDRADVLENLGRGDMARKLLEGGITLGVGLV